MIGHDFGTMIINIMIMIMDASGDTVVGRGAGGVGIIHIVVVGVGGEFRGSRC